MPLARRAAIVAAACLAAALAGCSSPSTPSTSLVASRPTSPSNNSAFSYYSQPVTLVVATGAATGGASPVTVVEVATDVGFTSVIATQTVSSDATGHATITLDHLSPATTYYWRVKTSAGDNPGAVASPQSFSIGPLLVIQAPTPVQPLSDSFPHRRPTFIVANATHTGPDATLTYRFDVAADAAFGNVVATGTAPEGISQTSLTPSVDLTSGATYYWRAEASDTTKGVVGPFLPGQPFTTVFPEDGAFRYTLAIHAPSYCLMHSVHTGTGAFWGTGWTVSDYTFTGTLTVTSDTLQFSSDQWGNPPLLLGFARAQNQLAGSISGSQPYPTVGSAPYFNGVEFRAVVAGDSDNRGQFEGTFDGSVTLDREGFPAFSEDTCSTSGFTWTLTPH